MDINYIKNVSSKDILSIALEFISRIDKNITEYNLKFAYVVYQYACQFKIPKLYIKNFVILAMFNDVGKIYARDNKGDTTFETYLFLKYFSPLSDFANLLLQDTKDQRARKYIIAKTFTDNYIKYHSSQKAFEETSKSVPNIDIIDQIKLKDFVSTVDLDYDFNSMRYKTILYRFISNSFFNPIKKNEFVLMLSSLFEMYSNQTLNHSKSTAVIAYTIANNLKLSEERQKNIYLAGLVHDLGKVCVPLSILEKDSKLTDDEYSIMKTHVTHTKEIIEGYLDYEIVEIAYRHHERLDGSGYPNHINEEYLTIDQRILEVSDVTSALLMKRSYKEAFSWEKCVAILEEEGRKNKLDKDIIKCVIDNQQEIISIFEKLYLETKDIYSKIESERKQFYSKKDLYLIK